MKRLVLALIALYQRRISPGMRPACRFQPTCSQYAYDAIESRGVLRGVVLGVWRIVRCNPLNDGGLDPAPVRNESKKTRVHG